MQRQSFLEYRDYRYLKLASFLAGVTIVAYTLAQPVSGAAYGGTWLGYVLGITSALLVLQLSWYGIHKRRTPKIPDGRQGSRRMLMDLEGKAMPDRRATDRRSGLPEGRRLCGGTLQGWLSAHVALGTLLVLLVSLHAGFRLAWNVHSLAYVLVLIVATSGIYGVIAYLRYPRLIAENMGDDTLSGLLFKIAELDESARLRAIGLPDEVNVLVATARKDTRVGGGFFQQLRGQQPGCPTTEAVLGLQRLAKQLISGDQPGLMRDLYALLLKKQRLVQRARKHISLQARMQAWLYVHVPLTVALWAAITAHVMIILIYW